MENVYTCYIEALLVTTGVLRRDDIVKAFGVSLPTATRHIAVFRSTYPEALEFESSDKTYRRGRCFTTQTLDRRHITPSEFLNAVRTVFGGEEKDK